MVFMRDKLVEVKEKCSHGEIEFLGEQKGEKSANKYFRCLKCGSVLIISEEGVLYKVPKEEKRKI
jgi:hypothetical protein